MPEGTVRGGFELSSEQALRQLTAIRDRGREADQALESLGRRMDEVGLKRVRPRIDLTGIDAANRKLTELEARLDRIGAKTARPNVSVGGGGGMFSPAAGLGGGGGGSTATVGRAFSTPGGIGGALPWWAVAAPFAPALVGGAGALIGSAGAGALGAGVVGLGGLGPLAAGAGLTLGVAKPAITDLQAVTKAQTAYNNAIQEFGRRSTQAATAARNLNLAVAQNPMAVAAARQVTATRSAFESATTAARGNVYSGISNVAFNARRAAPTIGLAATAATGASAGAAGAFSQFLASPGEQGALMQLSGAFAQELPTAERSLEHIATIFTHLAVDAVPFFHEANVWVESWTRGLAASSGDQARMTNGMQDLVTSARDWARLGGAMVRDVRDLFMPSVTPGNSMVVSLTRSLDRWDTWLRANPGRVRQFFTDAEHSVSRIATVIANVASDVWNILQSVQPLLGRATQVAGLASGLGGGSLLTGAGLLYGGYEGARRGAGVGGPSAGGAARSFVLGGAPRLSGGQVVDGAPAAAGGLRSRVAGGALGFVRGAAPIVAGLAAVQGLSAALGAHGVANAVQAGVSTGLSNLTLGMVSPHTIAPAALPIAGAAIPGLAMGALGALGRAGASSFANMAALPVVGRAAPALAGLAGSTALRVLGGAALGVPAAYASFMLNPENAGPRVNQGELRALAARASAVRTPQQEQAVLSQARGSAEIGVELDPRSAARLRQELQRITATAAGNAGAAASNTWETAFTRGIDRGMAPQRAVSTMLAGMRSQVTALGPQGARAFARDTATWAAQMAADNPRLQAPLNRLMNGITDRINRMNDATGSSFSDLQKRVFYFNGQILQGAQTTWGQIRDAMVKPSLVARERLSGIWGDIQRQAVNALTGMGFSRSQARAIVTATAHGGSAAANANVSVNLGASGGPHTTPLVPGSQTNLPRHERGGVIPGKGLLDTVTLPGGGTAAPGEAYIANRHTMNALSSATLDKYGKTAWEMIRDEGRAHSAPMQRGGGLPPIIQANSVRGHGELHAGISRAVSAVLGMFPGLAITSTTGGGHAGGSYHYRGEAADLGADAGTMFRAAQWINSSGLARQLTEGIHNPNLSVKFGRGVPSSYWGATTWGEHRNHIHMAVAGALNAGALTGGGVGGGGAAGFMPTALSLRSPGIGLGGIPGALGNQAGNLYAAGLSARINAGLGAGAGAISAAGFHGGGSAGANQALGRRMMLAAGWGAGQWPALQALWNQESGWSANAVNRSSGAYGIPQALGHGHPFNLGDAPAQIAWGLNYIRGRYGSPAAAEAHERSHNWYSRGGHVNWAGWNARGASFVTNGPTLFGAGETGREHVTVSSSNTGGAGGIHITMNGVTFVGGDERQLDDMARVVAGKILDAVNRAGGGGSDAQLAGVG